MEISMALPSKLYSHSTGFVSISENGKELRINTYSKDSAKFEVKETLNFDQKVLGVIPNDADNDGYLDLILTLENPANANQKIIKISLFDSKEKKFNQKTDLEIKSFKSQPVLFQKFDKEIQMLQTYMLVQVSATERKVYFLPKGGKELKEKPFSDFVTESGNCQSLDQIPTNTISESKASSSVDINGDCIPDLIIESEEISGKTKKSFLEIFLATPQGFCFIKLTTLGEDYLMSSFADLNNDGGNDLVLVNKNLTVQVFLNDRKVGTGDLCPKVDLPADPYENMGNMNDLSEVEFVDLVPLYF